MKIQNQSNHLVAALAEHALKTPQKVAFTFIQGELQQRSSLTFSDLFLRSQQIAEQLALRIQPQERVLLVYPSGLDFICAFMACLMSGAIAVPVSPPLNPGYCDKFFAIICDANPKLFLMNSSMKSQIERALSSPWGREKNELVTFFNNNSDILLTDELSSSSIIQQELLQHDHIALLQYTSGSTANPKGVIITHQNLAHNLNLMKDALGFTNETKGMSWLPHTHDMGLIGSILLGIYTGYTTTLMSPFAFLRNPYQWLNVISKDRLSATAAPNFAYEVCAARVTDEQVAALDLSCLNTVLVGAEPIHEASLNAFIDKFSRCGLKPNCFVPAYGLAEATLMVSSRRGLKCNLSQVSCGKPLQSITLVEPEKITLCLEGQVGEIWINSQSVGDGYWNKPAKTQQIFKAKLSSNKSQTYLRTGDLGVLIEGELYIVGRIKDVIIINGVNYYPQDLELTVKGSHSLLSLRSVVAFSVPQPQGREKLIILCEIPTKLNSDECSEISSEIRKKILAAHQLIVDDIVFFKTSLPKTTSGKIRRSFCKQAYIEKTIEDVIGKCYGTNSNTLICGKDHY